MLTLFKEVLKNYFSEQDSPFNIAIFRIIFFCYVLGHLDKNRIIWFSQLPAELKFPPVGLHYLLAIVPINPDLAQKGISFFMFFCFLAMIGCFARISSFLAAISGIYVLGIPQFYGKVDHYHHLIWFMFIFGCCRCADVLSIDSIWKAFKEADKGEVSRNLKSNDYALPLRFIWLLMGVIYFFPGLWKVITCQWYWVFSDNLKNLFYRKWFEFYGWVPFFRIDHHPYLYKMCALGNLLFETSFVFLVLFPSLRMIPVILGILFHCLTNVFMRISFFGLQFCYVSFIDWAGILNQIGKRLFKKPLYVIYDGNCKVSPRIMAFFTKFDFFQCIVYVNALDHESYPVDLSWINSNELVRDVHVVVGKNKWVGYEAYCKLAPRILILWPIYMLLWMWPGKAIGQFIYRKVVDSKLCGIRKPVEHARIPLSKDLFGNHILKFVGSFLLIVNIIFGLWDIQSSWPFACYPTFAERADKPVIEIITPYEVRGTEEIIINLDALSRHMHSSKFNGMIQSIIAMPDGLQKRKKLEALVILMKENGVSLGKYSKIRFYKTVHSTLPEKFGNSLISRKLIAEINQ